jgi:hypothetical protein
MVHGDFIAEITVNGKSNPVLFHYVVTRKDAAAILEWGQTMSVHAAIARAKVALKRLADEGTMPGAMVGAD